MSEDKLDKYIASRIDALLEKSAEKRQRVYLIRFRTRGDWEKHLVGIFSTPEKAGRGLGLLLKEQHPGEELELRVISDNMMVGERQEIPAGEAWVTRNGSVMWTSQIVAEVEAHEVDA